MAKRKRLSPAQSGYLSGAPEGKSALAGPLAAPVQTTAPIAQVASEASSHAALQELSEVLQTARARGLMIEEIALDAIDETHLVRDRITQDEDEMAALMSSIRSRGQQTPIEVVPLQGRLDGKTWGLISGWRRLSALRRLYTEDSGPEFATVKALVIRPESAEAAYVAMVEENEIRVNLSHYERARIAVRALKEGVFPTQKKALQGLFANAPRAKRSKIGSFVTLVEALDAVLYFPAAISEKLGLALVRQMTEDAEFAERLIISLQENARSTAAEELFLLNTALEALEPPHQSPDNAPLTGNVEPEIPLPAGPRLRPVSGAENAAGERVSMQVAAGLRLGFTPDAQRIELSGTAVDAALLEDLKRWLKQR
ncbi:plasmid partitioning protein RepB [Phaeobacter sp. CECT 5382]|uniref:ParB/RepB/Spo0J family partition protein n=1 Tax=Phaeobacter sp. CECT 5382 TaxID=1712645 RepID=UPI0006D9B5DD|nr:ParB N-terminal domain-containing protein [Phaeobacter sp. CECT 5382]CUH89358.1 plasmid partitioning protein RepB [Phaeobacter sp. CECT 5382]